MHHSPSLFQLSSDSIMTLDLSCTMKVLLTTCLLFTLLSAVTSLKCYQCGYYTGFSSCLYPKVVECAKHEDSCMDEFSFSYFEGERFMGAYAKRCVDSKSTPKGSYFLSTAFEVNIIGNRELCQRELCNNKKRRLLRRSDVEENGRRCPACIALGSDDCEAQDSISCRGNETKCLYTSAMAKGPEGEYNFALEGCATPNLCNIPKGEYMTLSGMITNITYLKCTNAPMSPSALEGFAPHLLGSLPFMGMKQRPQGPGN